MCRDRQASEGLPATAGGQAERAGVGQGEEEEEEDEEEEEEEEEEEDEEGRSI